MIKGLFSGIGVAALIMAGFFVGKFFGFAGEIVGGLAGAGFGSYLLKHFNVIPKNSALVSETSGVRTAKYILLAVILVVLGVFVFYVLSPVFSP